MKKRRMAVLAAAAAMVGSLIGGGAVSAENPRIVSVDMPIEVLFDARKLASDVKPKLVDGTVLVPLRVIAEKMDSTIVLNGNNITVTKGKNKIELTIGSKTAVINGKPTTLLQAATVENGRTLVPLRVISEGLNVAVEWDGILKFVWVGSKEVPELNDIVKPTAFKPYMDYYKGGPTGIMDGGYGTYTNATVVELKDFPYKSGPIIYYRFDLAYDQNNNVYMQSTENTISSINPRYYLLSKGSVPVYSNPLYYLRQIPKKGIHIYYNDTRNLGGKYSSFRKIEYIDAGHTIPLGDKKSSAVLIKNPWRLGS
ncbi:copper amine oxidase N-terminal domain-containing protein [Paenibacillus sp. UNC496MF]|uniref:copper amine oxidase N-terminal domain-containing protein n=1 Tax=Paenibacillus sp. UNC496MF TaxID=1502753 RepID=UPI000B86EBAC|nr:copper amine oxidase N-terminal domain-containing protein [Paenibacillus sp. UNC496MF]